MTKLFLITKTLMKTSLFSQFSAQSKKKKKRSKSKNAIFISILAILIIASVSLPLTYSIATMVKQINGIDDLLVSLMLPIAGLSTILFSIFGMVSVFYLNSDSEHLLPLPIKSKDLLMAKFLIAIINNYFLLLIFIFPILLGIGIGSGAGVLFYGYSLLIFILLPIIPSVLMCFIIMFLMSFFSIAKYKDKFVYFASIFAIALSLGYSFLSQMIFNLSTNGSDSIPSMEGINQMLAPYLKGVFPFFNSAVMAINNYGKEIGLFSLITFIGLNLIFLVVLYLAGDKLYIKGITRSLGNSNNKKGNVQLKFYKNENKLGSCLIKKDWLIIKRTPIFMLNLVVVTFLTPIIIFMSTVMGINGSGEELTSFINANLFANTSVYIIIMMIFVFFASVSAISASAISREGKNAWFMKSIPVSFVKQINSKVFLGIIIDFIGLILFSIVPVILFKPPFVYIISLLFPLMIIIAVQNYLSIIIDLKRPFLTWQNDNEAVKQNINVLFSILISLLICLILGLVLLLTIILNLTNNIYILSLIISFISLGILLLLLSYIRKNNRRLFEKIG